MEAVNMTKYQETALDLYLSEWPRDWEYEEVLGAVRGEMDAYISVWIPFEHWPGDNVAREIDSTRDLLETRFVPRKKSRTAA
jgi:hypothetical protein